MIILKVLLLILAIGGVLLFAHGLKIKNYLSIFFGLLLILTPMVWLTIGIVSLPLAPVLVLGVMYTMQQLDKNYT